MITSAEEFVALRTSDRQEDYLRATAESASNDVWMDVVARFPAMRVWVAHNKTVSIEVLHLLARDPELDVRVAVAMKNKLSNELFELLASDDSEAVRERLAYNKNTPITILERLAEDTSELVSTKSRERLQR